MKLIVGLGNPGREYKNTRHNVGFMVLDNYLGKVDWKNKVEAYLYKDGEGDNAIIYIKPLTYMNLSGLAVSKFAKFYKIKPEDILVIQDDLDMEVGTFKIKRNSSAGGHNGIKSIIKELESEEFARLKIGIGKSATIPTDKYVLGKFTKNELESILSNTPSYNKIIDLFISDGIEKALNYNNI